MARRLPDGFLVVVVGLINRLGFFILGRGLEHSLPHGGAADVGAVLSVVGHPLRQDIPGAAYGLLRRLHALFLGNVRGRRLFKGLLRHLHENQVRQRLQPFLFCDGGSGAAFGLIGAVQIFHRHQGGRRADLMFQLRGQFFLVADGGDHLLLAVLQVAQIAQALVQIAQHLVV